MTGGEPVDTEGIASTPGVAGYMVAVGVSWLTAALSSGLLLLGEPLMMASWAFLLALFALLTAPLGVVAVHLLCERFDAQWVHVLAAGAAGSVAVVVVASLFSGGPSFDLWRMALGVGACTAFGRAVVTPWVPVVRLRAPSGAPFWRRLSLR